MRIYTNSFISLLLGWAVLGGAMFASTICAVQDEEPPQVLRSGETHFVVFAPNQFDQLHDAPEFKNGMRKISEQLIRSGLPERNVVLLHGQADDPSRLGTIENLRRELERLASVSREDRIVLFALTHGTHVNGKDYLADQKTSRNGFLSGNENEMIAVAEIAAILGKSPAEHKWVLIDPAALELPIEGVSVEGTKGVFIVADSNTSDELLARYADDAFGTAPLVVPNNFVISINRGRRVHQSADENFISSVFLRSFIFAISTEDRFARHRQQVLLRDTLETMNRFLAANNHPVPVVNGSFSNDALLLPNRAESAGLIPISPEMWQYAIAQEIETASKLILLYYRPQDAIALLRQTEAQLSHLQNRDPQFRAFAERVRILRRMAQGMLGEAELLQAWQEAQQVNEPLFLYVLREPGTAPTSQLMVGRLVRVSKLTAGGGNTIVIEGGRRVTRPAPPAIEYDFAVRLRLVNDSNSRARKLTFIPIDSSRVGELPSTVFVLGSADPVSPFLESAFNREELE